MDHGHRTAVGIYRSRRIPSCVQSRGRREYGRAGIAEEDLLIVYAEAFEKGADPEDFSLNAILAHQRGHQMLARHPLIAQRVAGRISDASEEILASLLGAMICEDEKDRDDLIAKAAVELIEHGESPGTAYQRLQELKNLFEALL